jgi:hypothetical protein
LLLKGGLIVISCICSLNLENKYIILKELFNLRIFHGRCLEFPTQNDHEWN